MTRFVGRLACVWAMIAAILISAAPPALADAAGPTDYNTEITSIEPPTDVIRLEMIGGDAFLLLEQLAPVEIIVSGYESEPYLRFAPNGQVFENRRSRAVWVNQERYGTDDPIPAFVDAEAEPQWAPVADGGSYAWHDHRSHWMNPQKPPGSEAGDQVIEAVVTLFVDGQQVNVTVKSFLLASPSWWPTIGGAIVGLALVGLTWRLGRLGRSLLSLGTAAGAALFGVIAFLSVPIETQPSPLLWFLPTIAFFSAVVLTLVRNLTATTVYLDGLAVAAGAALAGWGYFRIDALRRALIPSDAPADLDRLIIAATLIAGAAFAVQGFVGLLHPKRLLPIESS